MFEKCQDVKHAVLNVGLSSNCLQFNEELSPFDEYQLTLMQAREFLEEKRGFYNLTSKQILTFVHSIYQYESNI
jgi:hypothetical protein